MRNNFSVTHCLAVPLVKPYVDEVLFHTMIVTYGKDGGSAEEYAGSV